MAATSASARTPDSDPAELRLAGQGAAGKLLEGGVRVGDSVEDVPEEAFADGFLEALSQGLSNPPGWMRDVLDGTRAVAASLNTEPEHGFVELIQNADDVGATVVRFALSADGRKILVVHDGRPVRPVNVLAMTLALVSTKVSEADATGKFGIGLKTVLRFASSYEVHCAPYRFRVIDQTLRQVTEHPAVEELYAPEKPETLVSLALLEDFQTETLPRWFETFSADGLMFMQSVRRLELRDQAGALLSAKELYLQDSANILMSVGGMRTEVEQVRLRDATSGVGWWRLSTKLAAPAGIHRSGKKTPTSVPFSIAYGDNAVAGSFFAGLPLAVGGSLPFHVNSTFDPNASRTDLLEGAWNEWTLDRLTDFAAAIAVQRLADDTRHGWNAVPLTSEVNGLTNQWLASRLASLVQAVQASVRKDGQIQAAEVLQPITDFRAEVKPLEPLVSDSDIQRLTGFPGVKRKHRDPAGRWRTVLEELDSTSWVDVKDAFEICGWEDLDRPGSWFVSLIDVTLSEAKWAEPTARRERCLLMADGSRVSPDEALKKGLLLGISGDGPQTLGQYLGLLRPIDTAFLADVPASVRVRTWLTESVGLRTQGGDDDALAALAGLDVRDPVRLDDRAVLLLRDALRRSPDRAPELGPAVGQRVLVDGYMFQRGRRELPVRPAEAYLPPAIDTGKGTWPRAAAKTPGLKWIHPRYKNLLASLGGRGQGQRDDPEEARRRRATAARERSGAQSFFATLGAETAPRLVPRPVNKALWEEWASTVSYSQLLPMQRAALGDPPSLPIALQNDHYSPDLIAVLEDVERAKVAEGRERAKALLRSLSRAWGRKYAAFEEARVVQTYYSMTPLGAVPATWTAAAAEIKWMTNERGQRRKPKELAVRTAAFELVFGDAPSYYAFSLGPDDADSGPVRAFGFLRQLRASGVIERLAELREQELSGKSGDPDAVSRCYRALADAAPPPDARGRRLDDVKVSEVQKLFRASTPGATGLVRTIQGAWRRPSEVLLGRPIFQTRASFVSVDAPALWQLLKVRHPTAEDCLRILSEIAAEVIPSSGDEAILIDTYRYLVQLLSDDERPPQALLHTPVRTMHGWAKDRPVYAVEDQALQLALGERVPVWQPRVRLVELEGLLSPLGITKLDESAFGVLGVNSGALAAGSEVQRRIRQAVPHLREWLALTDAELHDKLAEVSELDSARAAVTQKLYVQVTLPDGREEEVPRQAHVERRRGQLMFVFADDQYVEDGDIMGRLLGNLVAADQRAEVMLAYGWQTALDRLKRDVQLQGIELAVDAPERTGAENKRGKSKISGARDDDKQKQPSDCEDGTPAPTPPSRKLKRLGDVQVELQWTDVIRPPRKEPSRKPETPPRRPDPNKPGPTGNRSGPMSWTSFDRETLGLKLLQRALESEGLQLRDIRNQTNVGADAIDQNDRYYELKTHAGDMLDVERLEPAEFGLAWTEKSNFVLVIVSGLEEGYETGAVLIPDPLKQLRWQPSTGLLVSGITKAASLVAGS